MVPPTTDQGAIPVLIKSATTKKEPEVYNSAFGNKNQYKQMYRQGYERGYQQGYNGQGYNNSRGEYNPR